MIIKITECEATYGGRYLFSDLDEYKTLLTWVEALVKGETSYRPLDCSVRIDDRSDFSIYHAGELQSDSAEACLKALRKMPARYLRLPRDRGEIKADTFESDLYISLI